MNHTPPTASSPAGARTILGHPPGLFLLFAVEMWERFSYYGMRGLLVLYLIAATTGDAAGFNPGRGWPKSDAATLYGWYTGLAYLFPILGGIIADKLIGTHRSMLVGGLLITIGHVVLAISGLGTLAENALGMSVFITGLALIVLGTGHFKPSVSVMVGQLYPQGDERRDAAFTIFYMGINLGAFLCAFICGTLGEKVGWHWGFGSAAVGMIGGLVLYAVLRPRYLAGVGLPPAAGTGRTAWAFLVGSVVLAAVFGAAYHAGWPTAAAAALASVPGRVAGAAGIPPAWALALVAGAPVLAVVALAAWFVAIQRPEDRGPTASIFLFMAFNVFFWVAFEQAGSSINVFTEQNTDRRLFGMEVPATWFQSVNAGLIFLLAPAFAGLWTRLGRRHLDPSQPLKIALGLLFLGLGYVFMVWAGLAARDGAKASMLLILLTYFWHTVGELCVSPTGLSYVTKVAPARFVSLLMGVWFISSFIANLAGGLIAARVEAIERGEIRLPWNFGGQADFFFLFVVSSLGMGLLVAALTPLLRRLIGGRDQAGPAAGQH
jgi:POT family proton-dependent oligopeptide transporter